MTWFSQVVLLYWFRQYQHVPQFTSTATATRSPTCRGLWSYSITAAASGPISTIVPMTSCPPM